MTDSIPIADANRCDKVVVRSVAPLFAQGIRCINEEASISGLFHEHWDAEGKKEDAGQKSKPGRARIKS